MTLRQEGQSKRFLWQRGNPVGVESDAAGEDLLSVLVAEGIVDETDTPEIHACMRKRSWDTVRAVAALQKAAPKDLVAGLGRQIERALVACFAWNDGDFEMAFEAEAANAATLPVDVLALIHAGIAEHWTLERVLMSLDDRATGRPTPGARFDEVRQHLPDAGCVRALLSGMDGAQTAFSLLQQNPQAPAWAALWLLDAASALEWAEATRESDDGSSQLASAPEIEIVVSGGGADAAESERHEAEREGDAGALDDRAVALRDEVQELHARLAQINHYELLGLERDVNPAQIKRAYLKAAKRLHPDRLSNPGLEETKDAANEVFAQITRAHKTLSDVAERRSYDASLDGHTILDADRIAQAEVFFLKGEALLRAGNFLDAAELLDAAVQVWPEEADYQAALAWALHRKNPPENERSLEHFERALELGGERAQTLLRMSYAVKEMGDAARAETLAAKARELDPSVRP